MCVACEGVTAQVMLAAAERELILAQTETGESVPHATRPLSAAEKRAKMRFGEIDKLESAAAEKAAKLLASNAQVYIMAVIGAIFGAEDSVAPDQVVDAIERVNKEQPKAVVDETARAQKGMSAILSTVYAGAAEIVIGEALRQGVKKTPKPFKPDTGRFDTLAKSVALHPWTRLTSKLQADMLEPRTLAQPSVAKADVQANLEAIPLDGAVDLARQSIHTAHGAGRIEAAETMAPEEIYSSELLDGATCDACEKVDGKDYDTIEEAKVEYETGGYGACKGGARCRGTLVFQYSGLGTDAPQAKPAPEPEPEPAPAPKAPRKRKPATPKPAATPEPAAPGLPPAPTATPPKRRKGASQRYDSLDQLPIDHGKATDSPLLIARDTNPGRKVTDGADKNYSHNCSSVVNAYEMQRRGYDVKAGPVKAGRGRYDDEYVSQWWEDADGNPAKMIYVDAELPKPKATVRPDGRKIRPGNLEAKAKLDEYIESLPDGARGFVAKHYPQGGGHVFNWEKVNGKAVYLEGQTGVVDGARHLEPGNFTTSSLRVVRIDDKIPTNAVTEALETRPAELAAELAGKLPTVAVMKKQSAHRMRVNPDGTRSLIPAKYRVNPFTRKWEEIPPDVIAQVQREFDDMEAKRKR
jgi:hypothetical protein